MNPIKLRTGTLDPVEVIVLLKNFRSSLDRIISCKYLCMHLCCTKSKKTVRVEFLYRQRKYNRTYMYYDILHCNKWITIGYTPRKSLYGIASRLENILNNVPRNKIVFVDPQMHIFGQGIMFVCGPVYTKRKHLEKVKRLGLPIPAVTDSFCFGFG